MKILLLLLVNLGTTGLLGSICFFKHPHIIKVYCLFGFPDLLNISYIEFIELQNTALALFFIALLACLFVYVISDY